MHLSEYACIYEHTYICMSVYVCVYTFISNIYICIYTYTHVNIFVCACSLKCSRANKLNIICWVASVALGKCCFVSKCCGVRNSSRIGLCTQLCL